MTNTKGERIFASDVENVHSADILVDTTTRAKPIIGLRFDSETEHIVVPMDLDFAEEVGKLLIAHAAVYRNLAAHKRA